MLRALVDRLMQGREHQQKQQALIVKDTFKPQDRMLREGVYRLVWHVPQLRDLFLSTSEYFSLSGSREKGLTIVHQLIREDRFRYHAHPHSAVITNEVLQDVTPSAILQPFGLDTDTIRGYHGALFYVGGLGLIVDRK